MLQCKIIFPNLFFLFTPTGKWRRICGFIGIGHGSDLFFFITSSDSSSYVVATILSDDKEVRSFNKIAWSLIQCVAAMILFYCGGLALIQSASVVLGLLVLAIII